MVGVCLGTFVGIGLLTSSSSKWASIALAFNSSYPTALATSSALAVIPALVGMFIGQRPREKLNPDVFRRWFFWAMIAVGLFMIVRAIGHG
jgi:uncharacterized protein